MVVKNQWYNEPWDSGSRGFQFRVLFVFASPSKTWLLDLRSIPARFAPIGVFPQTRSASCLICRGVVGPWLPAVFQSLLRFAGFAPMTELHRESIVSAPAPWIRPLASVSQLGKEFFHSTHSKPSISRNPATVKTMGGLVSGDRIQS